MTRSNTRNLRRALSLDEIRTLAPSAWADERCRATTSPRYTYIPTHLAIEALMREGFQPVSARQADARTAETEGFTRHQIIFRAPEEMAQIVPVGGTFAEIRLGNSHAGGVAWSLRQAFYRLVCSNGMAVSAGEGGLLRARHSGGEAVVSALLSGAEAMIRALPRRFEQLAAWQETQLPAEAALLLSMSAIRLRWGQDDTDRPQIRPERFLQARRREDMGTSAWQAFNVVQENVINGGAHYRTASGRNNTVRPVSSIADDNRINSNLWAIADALVGAVRSNTADLAGALRGAIEQQRQATASALVIEGELVGA